MHVLLVLKDGEKIGRKVIVRLHKKSLKEKVITLLGRDQDKEAFDLISSEAEVHSYVPPNSKPKIKPDLILIEDMV